MAIIKNPGGAIGGGGEKLYIHYVSARFNNNTGNFSLNVITKSNTKFTPETFYNYLVNVYSQNHIGYYLLATGAMTVNNVKYRIDYIGHGGYQIFIHGYIYDSSNVINHSIPYTVIPANTFSDYIHELI